MFNELSCKRVVKVEQGVAVTFPIGFPAMVNGSRILDYLYGEEIDDYSRSKYSEKISPKEGFDPDWFRELKVRFSARVTAYVITVCSLDGILIQSYKHFLGCLQKLGYSALTPTDGGSKLIDERKGEISDYLFYRHKVFAHTSFAMPRRDSASLQHTSLEFYSGNLGFIKGSYLALGGGSVIIGGQEESVPEVNIVGEHQRIIDHYSKWESMFMDVLGKVPEMELSKKLERTNLL